MKKTLILATVLSGVASFGLNAADNVLVRDTKAVGTAAGDVAAGAINITEKGVRAVGNAGGAVVRGTGEAVGAVGRGVEKGAKAVTTPSRGR